MHIEYLLTNRSRYNVSLAIGKEMVRLGPGGAVRLTKSLEELAANTKRRRFAEHVSTLIRRGVLTVQRVAVPSRAIWAVYWHRPID